MKKNILVVAILLVLVSCKSFVKSTDEEIKTDVVELIRLETQIVDVAIKFQQTSDSTLLYRQDSISEVLQAKSESMQKKYTNQGQLDKFQEAFKKEKRAQK